MEGGLLLEGGQRVAGCQSGLLRRSHPAWPSCWSSCTPCLAFMLRQKEEQQGRGKERAPRRAPTRDGFPSAASPLLAAMNLTLEGR